MYSNVFSSFGYGPSGYAPKSEVSYDTSSKDPVLMRARVFVGNLNTNRVTREDVIQIFRAYGTLTGVTLFKGYAFVQYLSPNEADLSVSALNGYNWSGQILDVKLACGTPTGGKPTTTNFGQKRSPDPMFSIKGEKMEHPNTQNKTYAEGLQELPKMVDHSATPDTLICGTCRFVTKGVSDYIQHRKNPCTFFKTEGEPNRLQCFTCTDEFSHSWDLVQHLTTTHKLVLYKESPVVGADFTSNGDDGDEKADL
ncbi:RNA recognition motif domain-containing protein [Ditylenchus destructor]|nr:RNA recognition motif domain-containing protein [Ditylenchus destructor]